MFLIVLINVSIVSATNDPSTEITQFFRFLVQCINGTVFICFFVVVNYLAFPECLCGFYDIACQTIDDPNRPSVFYANTRLKTPS